MPANGPIFEAPVPVDLDGKPRLRVLCSYHYFKKLDVDRIMARFHRHPQVFADSGAWSAFSQGVTIEYDDFLSWCRRWGHHFTVISNLDDMHDPLQTWRNQQRLEADGVNAIPVFHLGEHFDWLRKYLDAGYRYLALGKMVGRPNPVVMRWLIACQKIARPYGAVFHGFGLTRPEAIQALPFYSVDSSSWASGHRWGHVAVWDDDRAKFSSFTLWNRSEVYAHGKAIRAAGFDPEQFLDHDRYHRSVTAAASAVAWLKFEAHVRRRLGSVALPAAAARFVRDDTDGDRLSLYMASSVALNLESAEEGLHLYLCGDNSHNQTNLNYAEEGLHLYLAAGDSDLRPLSVWQTKGADAL